MLGSWAIKGRLVQYQNFEWASLLLWNVRAYILSQRSANSTSKQYVTYMILYRLASVLHDRLLQDSVYLVPSP